MPQVKVPRSGSLQFVPKKRAKRIYPRVSNWHESDKLKVGGFAGYKAGMVQMIIIDNKRSSPTKGEQIAVPATVLDCPPLLVLGSRFYKQNINGLYPFSEIWDEKASKDKNLKRKITVGNYDKKNLGEVEKNIPNIKSIRLIVKTKPQTSGLGKKKPEVFEIELTGNNIQEKFNYSKEILGKEIALKDIFKEGEYIDVIAITKGKGFAGVMKRFNFHGRPATHGTHESFRGTGSIGMHQTPGRVVKGRKMPGHMGDETVTVQNLQIVKIDAESNLLYVRGAIPGGKNAVVVVRDSVKKPSLPYYVKNEEAPAAN